MKLNTIDPDNNPISFYIDWGDGKEGWQYERASGENCYYGHTWSEEGNYTIKAKAKDVLGEESDWTFYNVTIFPENIIIRPIKALYFMNLKIRRYLFNFRMTTAIGPISVKINPSVQKIGIDRVEFYIDGELKKTDKYWPYTWTWFGITFTPHVLKVIVQTNNGIRASEELEIWKFF